MIKVTQSRPASPAIRPITATLLHASLKKFEGCLTRSTCTVRFNGANRLPLFVFCTAAQRRKNASKRPTYIPGDTRVTLTNSTSVAHRWRSNQGEHMRPCLPPSRRARARWILFAPAGLFSRTQQAARATKRRKPQAQSVVAWGCSVSAYWYRHLRVPHP